MSLTVYLDGQPASPTYPNLVVGQTFELDYGMAMGGNSYSVTFCATLYLQNASSSVAWEEINKYLSPTGTESIRAGIQTDRSLNSNADDAWVGKAVQVEREEVTPGTWEYRAKFEISAATTLA